MQERFGQSCFAQEQIEKHKEWENSYDLKKKKNLKKDALENEHKNCSQKKIHEWPLNIRKDGQMKVTLIRNFLPLRLAKIQKINHTLGRAWGSQSSALHHVDRVQIAKLQHLEVWQQLTRLSGHLPPEQQSHLLEFMLKIHLPQLNTKKAYV